MTMHLTTWRSTPISALVSESQCSVSDIGAESHEPIEWVSGDDSLVVNWTSIIDSDAIILKTQLVDPTPFAEILDHAQDAIAYYSMLNVWFTPQRVCDIVSNAISVAFWRFLADGARYSRALWIQCHWSPEQHCKQYIPCRRRVCTISFTASRLWYTFRQVIGPYLLFQLTSEPSQIRVRLSFGE